MHNPVVFLRRNWGALIAWMIVSVIFFLVSGHLRNFLFWEFSILAITVLIWGTLHLMDWIGSYLNRSLGKFSFYAGQEADYFFKTIREGLKSLRKRLIYITVMVGFLIFLGRAFVPRDQFFEYLLAALIALLLNWTVLDYYVRESSSTEELKSDQTGRSVR